MVVHVYIFTYFQVLLYPKCVSLATYSSVLLLGQWQLLWSVLAEWWVNAIWTQGSISLTYKLWDINILTCITTKTSEFVFDRTKQHIWGIKARTHGLIFTMLESTLFTKTHKMTIFNVGIFCYSTGNGLKMLKHYSITSGCGNMIDVCTRCPSGCTLQCISQHETISQHAKGWGQSTIWHMILG